MANLYANFLVVMPNSTSLIHRFLFLNGREVPSAGKAMAKEKKNVTTSRSRQGILHIKRDLQGYNQDKISEECVIVNYSLCKGGQK